MRNEKEAVIWRWNVYKQFSTQQEMKSMWSQGPFLPSSPIHKYCTSITAQAELSALAKECKEEETEPGATLPSWVLCHQQIDVSDDTVGNSNREKYISSIILHLAWEPTADLYLKIPENLTPNNKFQLKI